MTPMPLQRRFTGWILGVVLLALPVQSHAQEITISTKPLSLTTFKHYIQYATVLNCLPRDKTTNVYQGLRKSSLAFAVLFAQSYGNQLENSTEKYTAQQAETIFGNEVAIQLLNVCPKSLSDSERSTIEALRAELLKRRSAPPARR